MHYTIEQYDKNGFLNAPKWLWLGWMLLAKAWVVFVVAGASRESGSTILSYVYPDHDMLYLGLIMGIPSIALMWLVSLRTPERRWACVFVSWGKPISLITAASQLMQSVYHVYLQAGAFSWANGLIMLLLLWFCIYIFKSKTVRDCFKIPAGEGE